MGLVHARLKIISTLGGAERNRNPGGDGIAVQFNPTEYTLARNINYADIAIPGLETTVVQFVRGETQTLSLELYLDRSDRVKGTIGADGPAAQGGGGDAQITQSFAGVDDDLAALRLLVTIDSTLHAPPVVEFNWGSLSFRGVVASYSEKFSMFDDQGHVLRARVTLMMKKYQPPILQAKSTNPQSPDRTKTRVVSEGERIDVIAVEEYGNAALWPIIASANNLARPRFLIPGSVLLIPPL